MLASMTNERNIWPFFFCHTFSNLLPFFVCFRKDLMACDTYRAVLEPLNEESVTARTSMWVCMMTFMSEP